MLPLHTFNFSTDLTKIRQNGNLKDMNYACKAIKIFLSAIAILLVDSNDSRSFGIWPSGR